MAMTSSNLTDAPAVLPSAALFKRQGRIALAMTAFAALAQATIRFIPGVGEPQINSLCILLFASIVAGLSVQWDAKHVEGDQFNGWLAAIA